MADIQETVLFHIGFTCIVFFPHELFCLWNGQHISISISFRQSKHISPSNTAVPAVSFSAAIFAMQKIWTITVGLLFRWLQTMQSEFFNSFFFSIIFFFSRYAQTFPNRKKSFLATYHHITL